MKIVMLGVYIRWRYSVKCLNVNDRKLYNVEICWIHITSSIAYFKITDQGGKRTWSNCEMWRCGGSTLHPHFSSKHPHSSTMFHITSTKHPHSSTMFHITSTFLHKTSTFLHNAPHNIHITSTLIHITSTFLILKCGGSTLRLHC